MPRRGAPGPVPVALNAVTACALFTVYGNKARYVNEVKASMARLKSLNPRVRVVLATDNLELSGVADRVDLVPASTGWTARVNYMANMSVAVPECDVTISLDSHARVCGTDLFERLATFYDSGALFGSNIEHAPYPGWSSSGLLIEQARANARSRRHLGAISAPYQARGNTPMPHNFAMVWSRSAAVDRLFNRWLKITEASGGEDQQPLRYAIQASRYFPHTRLPESFVLGMKCVHRKKFGMLPRFSYLIDGKVTLIHSHLAEAIPAEFNKDMCAFLNSYTGPRMVFRDQNSEYRLIKSAKECRERLKKYEPSYCDDRGLAYAATWPDAKKMMSWPFKSAPSKPTLVDKPFEASMEPFKRGFLPWARRGRRRRRSATEGR